MMRGAARRENTFLDLYNTITGTWVNVAATQAYYNQINIHVTIPFTWVVASSAAASYTNMRIKFTGSTDANDYASIRFAKFPAF
jgi:hypothetical protein